MTSRHVFEGTAFKDYTLTYNAENQLDAVSGAATASFEYDADGKQVLATVNGITAIYVGNHYEVKNNIVTKYYFAGATRLAVRTDGTLRFLLGDHLGSSSVTTDASGAKTASALYKAFGETRFTSGTLYTDYKFTGQREESALGGIYFFQARWFDPTLGRFMSPDTIVPTSTQGTQAWDRYAFVNNNPVRYTDPTGHTAEGQDGGCDPDDYACQNSTNSESYYHDQLSNYGWTLEGSSWSLAELKILYQVALDIIAAVGSVNVMMQMFGAVTFDRNTSAGGEVTGAGRISLNPDGGKWTAFGVAHELGHIWDQNNGWNLSQGLQDSVGSSYKTKTGGQILSYGSPGNGPALADGGWPSSGNDYVWNKGEDFANSFAGYVYPGKAENKWTVPDWRDTPRGLWIAALIPDPYSYPYGY